MKQPPHHRSLPGAGMRDRGRNVLVSKICTHDRRGGGRCGMVSARTRARGVAEPMRAGCPSPRTMQSWPPSTIRRVNRCGLTTRWNGSVTNCVISRDGSWSCEIISCSGHCRSLPSIVIENTKSVPATSGWEDAGAGRGTRGGQEGQDVAAARATEVSVLQPNAWAARACKTLGRYRAS